MAGKRAHRGRQQAEANRTAAVAGIDPVDQRRQFPAARTGGLEQIRLVLDGRDQVEQHDRDAERFIARDPAPELVETREQKAAVAPVLTPRRRLDETAAARKPVLRWRPEPRHRAAAD